jgi:hypothetical protein
MVPDVYAKTDEGRKEVARRQLGLNSRQRTVLILLDGRRPLSTLDGFFPAAQAAEIVGELLALGLVVPVGVPAAPAPVVESALLTRVKAEMVETAEACLGLLAADVVRRIDSATDEAALLAVVGHWHMALQGSKRGREAALAHVERIRQSLSGCLPA